MDSRHHAMVSTPVIMAAPTQEMEEVAMETTMAGEEGPDDMVEDTPLVADSKVEEEGSALAVETTLGS
jgi:hypothetical protein